MIKSYSPVFHLNIFILFPFRKEAKICVLVQYNYNISTPRKYPKYFIHQAINRKRKPYWSWQPDFTKHHKDCDLVQ